MGRWAGGVSRPVGWWVDSFFEVGGPWGDFPGRALRGPIPSIHFSNFKSIIENISDTPNGNPSTLLPDFGCIQMRPSLNKESSLGHFGTNEKRKCLASEYRVLKGLRQKRRKDTC